MIASETLPLEFNVATYFVDRNVVEGRGANVAIRCGDERITYDELMARARPKMSVQSKAGRPYRLGWLDPSNPDAQKYIKDLFDHYEPILGDDLTNSEDIFIGFAMNDNGYRNITSATKAIVTSNSAAGLTLSWPAYAVGFALESSSAVAPSVAWSPVAQAPALINDRWMLTVPTTGDARSYRLRR